MKEKMEKYIAELPAELREKARQCKDLRELSEFVAENDIELSDDALEMVAGGYANPCASGVPVENEIEDSFKTNGSDLN